MQGQSPALSSLPDPETGFSRVGAGSPDSSGRREYQAAGAVRVSAEPTCSVASVLGVPLLPRWGRCLEGHPELPGLRVGGLHGCASVCACGEASLSLPLPPSDLPEEKVERRRGLSGARGVIAGQPRLTCLVPRMLSNSLSHPEPFALFGCGLGSRPHWVPPLFQVLR